MIDTGLPQFRSRLLAKFGMSQKQNRIKAALGADLTAGPEANIWIGYFGQCALRAGVILFATFALAVLPVLVG